MDEILEISETKNYHTFGVYLGRRKLSNGHKLARILIQKFALTKKYKDWQNISADDLKEKGLLPCKKYSTFSQWRDAMLKAGILICMATKEELKEDSPNYKGNMFKIGNKASKYIDVAIQENLPKRVEEIDLKLENMSDKFDSVNENVNNVNSKVDRLESEVHELKENISNLITIVLEAYPPDTPIRRDIVSKNINNKKECLKMLADEIEKNIVESGRMFN